MSDESEKLDKEMMRALKETRAQKMPEGLLKGFSEGVLKEIQDQGLRPAAPGAGFGWASAGALVFAFLIFGAVIWKLLPVNKPETAVSVILRPEADPKGLLRGESREILRFAQDDKQKAKIPGPVTISGAGTSSKALLNETEILNEIQALKELGVWTEEDEEKMGITLEETFSELELAFEDNSQIPAPAVPAG